MYDINELKRLISVVYPKSIGIKKNNVTMQKRKANITFYNELILNQKSIGDLKYSKKELRIELYKTKKGEKIFIQFPGKESVRNSDKKKELDFRPKIMKNNGKFLRDLNFYDMWSIVENLDKQYHGMTPFLAALFFRMGRMIDYREIESSCEVQIIDFKNNGEEFSAKVTEPVTFTRYKLDFDDKFLEALKTHIPEVQIEGPNKRSNESASTADHISVEAFIYFFDLILQNEDCKYYDKKGNYSSGRIPTSDSMLLLSSYFQGHSSLSLLLQRYVSGYGVGRCTADEIEPATGGLIKIVDRKIDIENLLLELNIKYKMPSIIQVNGTRISVALKISDLNLVFCNALSKEEKELLEGRGWTVYLLDNILSSEAFVAIQEKLRKANGSQLI